VGYYSVEEWEELIQLPVREKMRRYLAVLIIVGLLLLAFPVATAYEFAYTYTTDVIAYPGEGILPGSATLVGRMDVVPPANTSVWFVYGTTSGSYSVRTRSMSLASSPSNFTYRIERGMPAGATVYYRAGSSIGYSSTEGSFVVPSLTPIPTTTWKSKIDELVDSDLNMENYSQVVPTAFTGTIRPDIFWGFVFGIVFIVIYIRSDSMLPALLGMFIGATLSQYVAGEYKMVGNALLIISIGAMVYIIIKGRFR